MKRIASAAAAAVLGMAPAVLGSTGSAGAAPSPKADVSAQECGLNQLEQSYTNCRGYPHIVSITYMDSTTKTTGSVLACAHPGTTPTINLIGPFRLAINSFENGTTCDKLERRSQR